MLSHLKDPWKLLVFSLVLANIIAIVAVVIMYRNKVAAKDALKQVYAWVHPEKNAKLFKEMTKLNAVRALKQQSGLESTDKLEVIDFIERAATKAALNVKNTSYSASTSRGDEVDHKYTVTFESGDEGIDRRNLSLFLFRIKSLTPQIKIVSITSGGSGTDHEDADRWKPKIVFVLTKEKAPSDAA